MEENFRKKERDHRIANAIYTIWRYIIRSFLIAVLFVVCLFGYRLLNGDIDRVVLKEQPEGWVKQYSLTESIPYEPWEAGYYKGMSCYDYDLGITPSTADDLNYIRLKGLKKELTRDGFIVFFGCLIFLIGRKYIIPKIKEGTQWVKENK